MTHQEILEKAIQKALEGGWKPLWVGDFKGVGPDILTGEWYALWQYKGLKPFRYSVAGILFMIPDFANALWGEEWVVTTIIPWQARTSDGAIIPWQYHLQQMVIDPNPIEYLGKHLDD